MQFANDTNLLTPHFAAISAGRLWTGWGISGLIAAFSLFDGIAKCVRPAQVVEAFARTAWPVKLAPLLGATLIFCTTIFLILQSGYLGGAVATNLRRRNPRLSHTLFPVYFGVLIWVGLWLREPRLGAVFPFLK
jgi:DoxX-like protein